MTLKQLAWFGSVLLASQQFGSAEIIELKDKATVNGKILTEKRDQIAVDIGYTVLVIPRDQISKISKSDSPDPSANHVVATKPNSLPEGAELAETRLGFYSTPTSSATVQNVRDIVNRIGEAVVQVRTPGG